MIKFKPASLKELNKKKRLEKQREEAIAELENALCEIDEANAERFAAIEDALCEIDTGGNNV